MMSHLKKILDAGGVAVITGAADGIGLASAKAFAARGLHVVMADLPGEALDRAVAEIGAIDGAEATGCATDVTKPEDLRNLAQTAFAFGRVTILMNNAGTGERSTCLSVDSESWARLMDVNFFGVLRGLEAFVPRMVQADVPAMIINTGSKQGITNPPGSPAYNATKAALKIATEQLAYGLREAGAPISAHLLAPGFTYTGLMRRLISEKPDAAWSADEVAAFLLDRLERGDFYILCPDNEVTEEDDRRRVAWSAGDISENRPALSRWHPDHADAFRAYANR